MENNIIIQLSGGVGKHISFTSIIPLLKEKYENIYIITPYPDLYFGNPNITSINPIMDKNFYKNVVLKDSTKIVMADPYDHQSFIKKQKHLLEIWGELCDIKIQKPMELKTEIFMNENEKFTVDKIINEIRESTKNKYILIQLNGGQSPHNFEQNGTQEFSFFNEGSKRHYPFDYYVELIKKIKDMYPEHTILRYGLMNEPIPYEIGKMVATMQPAVHYKNYYWLSKYASHIICIDSSLQHMTAGVKSSIVIWGDTKPEHFGYSIHRNLIEKNDDTMSYCRPFGESNQKIIFPSPEKVLYYMEKDK
jgi:ADP-heptose:LPS heptosyltransferase